MRKTLLLAAISFATSLLPAQTFYSPPGAEFEMGTSTSITSFGSTAGYESRHQQIDKNFIGNPLFQMCRSIAWRRGKFPSPGAVARVAEVTLVMAHSDYNSFSGTFVSNYKDAPATVFATKNVNLPNWTVTSFTTLAAYDLTIPFDIPWIYNQIDPLLWDITVTNTSAGGAYPQDWFPNAALANWGTTHVAGEPGCTTGNGVFNKKDLHRSVGSSLQVGYEISGGPSNALVIVFVGSMLQAQPVPGLCAPLGTDSIMALMAGFTNGSGNLVPGPVNPYPLTIPWQPDFAGLLLSAQAVAADPSQPPFFASVSNSSLTSLPMTTGAPVLNVKRTFLTGTGSSTGIAGTLPSLDAVGTRLSN